MNVDKLLPCGFCNAPAIADSAGVHCSNKVCAIHLLTNVMYEKWNQRLPLSGCSSATGDRRSQELIAGALTMFQQAYAPAVLHDMDSNNPIKAWMAKAREYLASSQSSAVPDVIAFCRREALKPGCCNPAILEHIANWLATQEAK